MEALRLEEERSLLARYDPLFASVTIKRRDIITGVTSVPPLESAKVVSLDADDGAHGIEEFWLTCMKNTNLAQIVEEHDEDLLSKLTDITTNVITGEEPGFAVHFHFAKNDYFTNDVLSLTLNIPDFPKGEDVADIKTTNIVWKNKKNLTKSGKEDRQSFFHIFDETSLEGVDEEDEEYEKIMGSREMSCTACFILREKLIPNAINWYTGAAQEDDDEDGGGGFEDGEGEYEEDEEDDEGPTGMYITT